MTSAGDLRPTADPARIAEAVVFAADAHQHQLRKAAAVDAHVTYLAHLMAVGSLVVEFGADTDTAVAAVLHDVIEDTACTESDLVARFGVRVADLVAGCSDTLPGDTSDAKSPWEERKAAYLDHLRTADADVALIAAADKFHNLSALLDGVAAWGPSVLDRFSASPDRTLWFYGAVLDAVGHRIPAPLQARYVDALTRFDELVAPRGA